MIIDVFLIQRKVFQVWKLGWSNRLRRTDLESFTQPGIIERCKSKSPSNSNGMNDAGLFFMVEWWAKGLALTDSNCRDATLFDRTVIPKWHGSPCLVTCVHGHRPSPQSGKISRKFREWNGSWDTEKHHTPAFNPLSTNQTFAWSSANG